MTRWERLKDDNKEPAHPPKCLKDDGKKHGKSTGKARKNMGREGEFVKKCKKVQKIAQINFLSKFF
jgi:hypothetical protein